MKTKAHSVSRTQTQVVRLRPRRAGSHGHRRPRVRVSRGSVIRRVGDPVGLIPKRRIKTYCDAVGREFRPSKIILFGSYAYGQPSAGSDVDLLIILPFRGSDVTKALEIRSRFDTPFPMDLVVRKPDFIARRLRERDMFIELIMSEGQVMYEGQYA